MVPCVAAPVMTGGQDALQSGANREAPFKKKSASFLRHSLYEYFD